MEDLEIKILEIVKKNIKILEEIMETNLEILITF